MQNIGLADAIDRVRRELADAVANAAGEDIHFPVGQVTLEFQVGLTRSASGSAGVNVWVVELGTEGEYAKESVQTVTVVLEPPVSADGRPVRVVARSDAEPG